MLSICASVVITGQLKKVTFRLNAAVNPRERQKLYSVAVLCTMRATRVERTNNSRVKKC
jgi:hypothetical protein